MKAESVASLIRRALKRPERKREVVFVFQSGGHGYLDELLMSVKIGRKL